MGSGARQGQAHIAQRSARRWAREGAPTAQRTSRLSRRLRLRRRAGWQAPRSPTGVCRIMQTRG
eukprot:4184681-Pyramimonas_sp.AAC.1